MSGSSAGISAYLKEAKRHSEPTVDAVAKALARFEADTRHRAFKSFHSEQAIAFKKHLAEQKAQRSGEKLSKATLHATLAQVKKFFHWLAGQPGYKSRLQYSDAEYFNLSEKDVRVTTARREQVRPTVEQVKHVIAMMPAKSRPNSARPSPRSSFPLARRFAGSWRSGWRFFGRRCFGATTIRSSRRRALRWGRHASLKR